MKGLDWSCDLRSNERPRKKLHPMAQTSPRTWRLWAKLVKSISGPFFGLDVSHSNALKKLIQGVS